MTNRREQGEQGQATVELAIVVGVFLIPIVAGLFGLAMTFNYWISLNNVSNEGARWAAVGKVPGNATPTGTQIKTYIKSQILTGGLQGEVESAETQGGGIKLCNVPSGPGGEARVGDPVTVSIVIPQHKIAGVMNIRMTGSSTMRLEQAPLGTAPSNGWDLTC